jgi:ribosomal-protein-alanine N-acetyltransferase
MTSGKTHSNHHSIRIRPAEPSDLAAIMTIERASQSHPWSESVMAGYLNRNGSGWVIAPSYVSDHLAGFAIITAVAGEAELLDIAVARSYRGHKYGERLLDFLLQKLQKGGIERVFLEVRASNAVAISLYEKSGFCQVGVRHGYYPAADGREDALIYAQELLPL